MWDMYVSPGKSMPQSMHERTVQFLHCWRQCISTLFFFSDSPHALHVKVTILLVGAGGQKVKCGGEREHVACWREPERPRPG